MNRPGTDPAGADDILRNNLRRLISPGFWQVAMSESVGGNAGRGCLAVNLEVDKQGRIGYIGNDAPQINATLRMYLPLMARGESRLRELIIEVIGSVSPTARDRLQKSAWLWNLHRIDLDRPILEKFLRGEIAEAELDLMLTARYPRMQ